MRTITFIYDTVLIVAFVCACTINVTAYCKTKHVRELGIGVLMFFFCLNAMIIFMSEFLYKIPFFEGAYNALTYFSVKVVCGITISALYFFLTADLLEKRLGMLHIVVLLPLICVTVYVGDLNASVRQHWIFYTIRQLYLAGFAAYYFISCSLSREGEYRQRMKVYRPVFILGGIFAGMILLEDSLVIYHFQYVINTLGLKVFMEHNVSEDIFFLILAAAAIRYGFQQLIHKKDPVKEVQIPNGQPFQEIEQEAAAAAAIATVSATVSADAFVTEYALSNRQQDVLYLLLKKKTYQDMGDELSLSVGTVKFHAHGIYDKTDSKNRSELIVKYRRFHENDSKRQGQPEEECLKRS